jgi:hypothetical protein
MYIFDMSNPNIGSKYRRGAMNLAPTECVIFEIEFE